MSFQLDKVYTDGAKRYYKLRSFIPNATSAVFAACDVNGLGPVDNKELNKFVFAHLIDSDSVILSLVDENTMRMVPVKFSTLDVHLANLRKERAYRGDVVQVSRSGWRGTSVKSVEEFFVCTVDAEVECKVDSSVDRYVGVMLFNNEGNRWCDSPMRTSTDDSDLNKFFVTKKELSEAFMCAVDDITIVPRSADFTFIRQSK